MGYVGIDIGKDACTATILTRTGRVRDRLDFANRPDGFDELAARLRPRDQLVMEAGTYVYPLHDHFTRLGYQVLVAHPRRIRTAPIPAILIRQCVARLGKRGEIWQHASVAPRKLPVDGGLGVVRRVGHAATSRRITSKASIWPMRWHAGMPEREFAAAAAIRFR